MGSISNICNKWHYFKAEYVVLSYPNCISEYGLFALNIQMSGRDPLPKCNVQPEMKQTPKVVFNYCDLVTATPKRRT